VYAERRRIRPGGGADDDAFVAVQHVGGAVSHHWMSAVAAEQGPRLRILGSAGALTVDGLDPQEDALRAGRLPDDDWGRDDRIVHRNGSGEPESVAMDRGRWPEFYRRMAAALLDDEPAPVPATAVRDPLAVLCAAVESAAGGQVVTLD
jgi:predicted dehydrogenase